jgi:hypothetical protein
MLYLWVVMAATLKLNAYLRSPYTTMWIIMAVMLLAPFAVQWAQRAYGKLSVKKQGGAL